MKMNTQLSRRSFLGRSAAATTISAIGLGHQAQAQVVENPQLLSLCDQFDAHMQEYRAALAFKDERRAEFERLAPPVPKRLVAQDWQRWAGDKEVDCENNPVWQTESSHRYQRVILNTYCIQMQGSRAPIYAKEAKIAARYEDMVAAARRVSGLEGALDAVGVCSANLQRDFYDISRAAARTKHGLLRKAQVAVAFAELGPEERYRAGGLLAQGFWSEIASILGEVRT
jgi:hypothetical protein